MAEECLSDWIPQPGKSLAVEVRRRADWVFMPGKQILIDVKCELFESCINDWFPQAGDNLELEFKCCADPCTTDWQPVGGDALILNAVAPQGPSDGSGIILDSACESVCNGTWYPQAGDNLDIEYICCDASGGQEIVITGVTAYEGQTFEFDYTSDKQFVILPVEGQTFTAALTAVQNVTFPISIETGETAGYGLSTAMAIPVSFDTGEQLSNVTLNTYPVIMLSANGYEGSEVACTLRTSTILAVTHQTGETAIAAVDTRPAQALTPPIYTGENATADLLTHKLFPHYYYAGETATGDLSTLPYQGIETVFDTGETAIAAVDNAPGFIIRVDTGETAIAAISTATALPIVYVAGETLTAAMYEAQYWNPAPTAYAGETLTSGFSVGRFSLGVIIAEIGEECKFDLKTNDKALLAAQGQHGETASIAISWAANIGNTNFYHGTTATVSTLDFDQLIRAYEGATASIAFATEMVLPATTYEGAWATCNLQTGPSQPLGQINAYHGSAYTVQTLALLKAVFLDVTFYNSYTFNTGLPYIGTFMDMDTGCCTNQYPGQQDYHIIEMNEAEFGDQRFDGDKIKAIVDFQTQPRFKFNFTHGETLVTAENNSTPILPVMHAGETLHVRMESRNINFALCPVNFIPDGDNVYAELDYTDDTACYADYQYTGENYRINTLEANQNFQESYTDGATMNFDFVITQAWVLLAYTGETARVNNPEFGANAATGETLRLNFYVEPIIAATGETATAELTTIYEVVFLEDGCLDNEYIWQDENGDPIPEKFNPVPVELDPFQHDIKAKCQ